MFIHRKEEKELNKILNSDKFEFIILYGRRRIGKTTFVKDLLKKNKGFYYLGLDSSKKEQLKRLQNSLGEYMKDDLLNNIVFSNYTELFSYILKNKELGQKEVIILDEFQYFFYKETSVLNEFQYIIDELLQDTKIKIIILGSSISMIENNILGYKSPLYGRKTAVFNMQTFGINMFSKFFPNYNLAETIEMYCCTNGVPYYAKFLDKNISPIENIKRNILKDGSIFLEEVPNILKYEISEFRTYFLILSYIATGANKFSEISSKTGLDKSNLTRYLLTLQEINIVKKETPILEDSTKSKKSLYKVDDLFMKFWFYYIWGNKDIIEFDVEKIHKIVSDNFDFYISSTLDKIIYNYILENVSLNFDIFRIGRQWDKNYELDICAFDYKRENILVGEIKWTNKKTDISVLNKLKRTSDNIKGFKHKYYILISKNGFTSDMLKIENKNLILIDLSKTKIYNNN